MEIPKPSQLREGFEKIAIEAEKGGDALKRLAESIPQNKEQGPRKPAFKRKDHLTQRPFNVGGLHTLRDGLRRNTAIKQK